MGNIADFIQKKRYESMEKFFEVGIKRFSKITLDELRKVMNLIDSGNSSHIQANSKIIAGRNCLVWGSLDSKKVVLHFHSGGYVTGDQLTSAQFCQAFYDLTGNCVICPDYPLAPELSVPSIVKWSKELLSEIGNKQYILSGVSAGANLVTLLNLEIGNEFNISSIHLITGHFQSDFHTNSANKYESGEESGLSKSMLLKLLKYAIGDNDDYMNDPKIFPLYANNLDTLADCHIYAATKDVLHDDSVMFFKRLKRLGNTVYFHEFKEGFHAWSNYLLENDDLLEYAKENIFSNME